MASVASVASVASLEGVPTSSDVGGASSEAPEGSLGPTERKTMFPTASVSMTSREAGFAPMREAVMRKLGGGGRMIFGTESDP